MKPAAYLEKEDIQGNVLRGYGFECAAYVFAAIEDAGAAKAWLEGIVPRVENAAHWEGASGRPAATLNVAFTHAGLAKLGLPATVLERFPQEFREGMAARAALLGDADASAPSMWDPGLRDGQTDLLITLHAHTASERDAAVAELEADLRGLRVVHTETAGLLGGQREHFGFTDGFAQPAIEGDSRDVVPGQGLPERFRFWHRRRHPDRPRSGHDRRLAWRSLKPGEFILGYPDEDGQLPAAPPDPFARNGTFMVWRKLEQDVPAFRRFTAEQGEQLGLDPAWVAAKMVGRWPDGSPLVLRDQPDAELGNDKARVNDYRYRDDPHGAACPLGSHVRRVNPRDALGWGNRRARRHRMLRRGMPYGPELVEGPDGNAEQERGLIFVCLQASIARQFEIVQSNWIGDGNLFGLGDDRDPLIAVAGGSGRMVLQGTTPRLLGPLPSLVTLRGGAYLFVPGLAALRAIATA